MSRFWSSIQRLVTVALFAMICGALLYAQSTTDGAIGGTVYDTNGAVVANATITVHNNGTNAEQKVTADASGYYRVTKLASGIVYRKRQRKRFLSLQSRAGDCAGRQRH